MSGANKLAIEDLRSFFIKEKGIPLLSPDQLSAGPGLPTHCKELDSFLIWKGLPIAAVSLFHGNYGLGATRLWLQTAGPLMQKGQWVAWMNPEDCKLTPWFFQQQKSDLSKLILISAPATREEWFWALEETLSLSLFELIGFAMGPWSLRNKHIIKLQQLTRRYQSAVVLLAHNQKVFPDPFYSLIIKFDKHEIKIERARHRPTPQVLRRRQLYADFVPQLTKGRQALRG